MLFGELFGPGLQLARANLGFQALEAVEGFDQVGFFGLVEEDAAQRIDRGYAFETPAVAQRDHRLAAGQSLYGSHAEILFAGHDKGTGARPVSDSAGAYSAPSLSVGRYKVTVEKQGFGTRSETGINLVVGQSTVVNLSLSVGTLQQQVSVTDVPLAINTTTQQTSGLVNQRQVKDLPLNGRSYDELVTLNPATVNYTSERSGGCGHFQFFRGKYVRDFGASPPGQSFSAEWN